MVLVLPVSIGTVSENPHPRELTGAAGITTMPQSVASAPKGWVDLPSRRGRGSTSGLPPARRYRTAAYLAAQQPLDTAGSPPDGRYGPRQALNTHPRCRGTSHIRRRDFQRRSAKCLAAKSDRDAGFGPQL